MTRLLCGFAIASVLVSGCTDQPSTFQGAPVKVVTWDSLDELMSDDVMRPVIMPADMNDWAGVKAGVSSETFKAAVEEFANAPIPSELATPEREAAKEELVKNYRALIEAAEKGAAATELQAAYEAADKSMAAIKQP